MSTRSGITVSIDAVNHVAEVAGFHAKRLIRTAGGRPFWSRRARTWVTTEIVAADVVAMAESEGIPVALREIGGTS